MSVRLVDPDQSLRQRLRTWNNYFKMYCTKNEFNHQSQWRELKPHLSPHSWRRNRLSCDAVWHDALMYKFFKSIFTRSAVFVRLASNTHVNKTFNFSNFRVRLQRRVSFHFHIECSNIYPLNHLNNSPYNSQFPSKGSKPIFRRTKIALFSLTNYAELDFFLFCY